MYKYHNDLICYNQTEIAHDDKRVFFLNKHSTKEGTWGLLQVTGGEINFIFLDGEEKELSRHYMNATMAPLLIPPAAWHKIEPISEGFYANLEFYCKPHRYFVKKHQLGNVHSDLLHIYQTYLQGQGKLDILDVGAGSGRNALYLALAGHNVTALDIQEEKILQINNLAQIERLENVSAFIQDLNQPLQLDHQMFNLIIATVSLQFLKPERIPSLLSHLQQVTRSQGLHFLVFPIESSMFPLPASFTYLPMRKELYHFYQDSGWSIVDYTESVGQLHKLDKNGKPIQGLFACLLAQKGG